MRIAIGAKVGNIYMLLFNTRIYENLFIGFPKVKHISAVILFFENLVFIKLGDI